MNEELLIIFLIIHLIGDFYLQSNTISEMKERQIKGVFYHGILYCVPFALYFMLGEYSFLLLISFLILCISHFFIDCMKFLYIKKIKRYLNKGHIFCRDDLIYLVDQGLHLTIILILSFLFSGTKTGMLVWISTLATYIPVKGSMLSHWILLILLIYKPMNITHSKLFSQYKPSRMEEVTEVAATKEEGAKLHMAEINAGQKSRKRGTQFSKDIQLSKKAEREKKAGALIGFMERLIIIIFLHLQQYAAIGLVLTAKSIVRYDRISKEQEFSEYYLIGTLFSFIAALVSYFIIAA